MAEVQDIVPDAPDVRLWIPGLGSSDRRMRQVQLAIKDYDPDLRLARHELTGDWVVLIGDAPMPVLGLGRELPEPTSIRATLEARDTKRHGKQILDALAQRAAAERLRATQAQSDHNEQLAERLEHAYRQLDAHPEKRVFLNEPAKRRGGG